MYRYSPQRLTAIPAFLLFVFFTYTSAQVIDPATIHPSIRVRDAVDERNTVELVGNTHPLARAENDRGAVAGSYRMEKMILVLSADPLQERALDALIEAQQNPDSPQYHHWLTPESFGEHFGGAPSDLDQVTGWLRARGFIIDGVAPGGRSITFSGTAAQVRSAFQTEIHEYEVSGKLHHANASDPRIPAALAGVVSGVASLHDFPRHSMIAAVDSAPAYSAGSSHYVAPEDFAAIYDVAPLYSGGINGTSETIAVLGRSNINVSDVTSFRSMFGLPANNPTVTVNGANPGIVSGDETEADLDVEWSGAVAPLAAIRLIVSASTSSSDGIDLSAEYAVSNNIAPVITLSYGSCESDMGSAGLAFYRNLWQQAAAQGITVLVSAGDSGAAGCDSPSEAAATGGLAVSGLCSTPSNICVGGTEFSEGGGTYWSTSNDGHYGSARNYIPEVVWNESGANSGSDLWAGGGGASAYFARPSWQSGPGVPSDGHRDVPDVSLAAGQHDAFLMYSNGKLMAVSGTSVAAPSFAGLMALVDQSASSSQGNAASTLYSLAAAQASGGVACFHDITTGNNSVPGVTGFSAGHGYDLASGLGSVDANALITNWTAPAPVKRSATIALLPSATSLSVAPGSHATLSLFVSASAGFNSMVMLTATGLPSGLTAAFSPVGLTAPYGSDTLTLTAAAGMKAGVYPITLSATGGGASSSVSIAVTVGPAPSFTITASPASLNIAPGGSATTTLTLAAVNGYHGTVQISTGAAPSGILLSFSAVPGASNELALTVRASSSAARGSWTLAVKGVSSDGTITSSTSLAVTITAAAVQRR